MIKSILYSKNFFFLLLFCQKLFINVLFSDVEEICATAQIEPECLRTGDEIFSAQQNVSSISSWKNFDLLPRGRWCSNTSLSLERRASHRRQTSHVQWRNFAVARAHSDAFVLPYACVSSKISNSIDHVLWETS